MPYWRERGDAAAQWQEKALLLSGGRGRIGALWEERGDSLKSLDSATESETVGRYVLSCPYTNNEILSL